MIRWADNIFPYRPYRKARHLSIMQIRIRRDVKYSRKRACCNRNTPFASIKEIFQGFEELFALGGGLSVHGIFQFPQ